MCTLSMAAAHRLLISASSQPYQNGPMRHRLQQNAAGILLELHFNAICGIAMPPVQALLLISPNALLPGFPSMQALGGRALQRQEIEVPASENLAVRGDGALHLCKLGAYAPGKIEQALCQILWELATCWL